MKTAAARCQRSLALTACTQKVEIVESEQAKAERAAAAKHLENSQYAKLEPLGAPTKDAAKPADAATPAANAAPAAPAAPHAN